MTVVHYDLHDFNNIIKILKRAFQLGTDLETSSVVLHAIICDLSIQFYFIDRYSL